MARRSTTLVVQAAPLEARTQVQCLRRRAATHRTSDHATRNHTQQPHQPTHWDSTPAVHYNAVNHTTLPHRAVRERTDASIDCGRARVQQLVVAPERLPREAIPQFCHHPFLETSNYGAVVTHTEK